MNTRVKKLCFSENIEFLDLWDKFLEEALFAKDRVHLNQNGVKKLSECIFEKCQLGN